MQQRSWNVISSRCSYWMRVISIFFAFFLYTGTVYCVFDVSNRDPLIPTAIRLQKVCWIHIQKASSWIGDFLYMLFCPHTPKERNRSGNERDGFLFDQVSSHRSKNITCRIEFCPKNSFGFHMPYAPSEMRGHALVIFRQPLDRIISAYLFREGMMIPVQVLASHSIPNAYLFRATTIIVTLYKL